MKSRFWYGVLGLLLTLIPVQSALSQTRGAFVYSRIFTPVENAVAEYYTDVKGTVNFSLERIQNPDAVLLGIKDWRNPNLPENVKTTLVKRFTRNTDGNDYGYGTLEFGRLPEGAYAIRARQGKTESRALLLVSKLGLIVKRSESAVLTWTVDALSGKPVSAKIYALESGKAGANVTADASGLGRWNIPEKKERLYLAKFGSSWAVSGSSAATWNLRRSIGYVYSERPVYRPGDSVFLKGILRDGRTLQAKAGQALKIRVFNQEQNLEVYKGTVTTNAYGSFAFSVDLPTRARTGQYVAQVSSDGTGEESSFNGLFKVESYQKPDYSVTVTLPKKAVQGDRVTAKISAAYLFGGKVGNARVKYTVGRSPVYDGWWYASRSDQQEAQDQQRLEAYERGYDYGNYAWWQPPSETIISESGRLNAQGELSFPLPISKQKDGLSYEYTLTATVEDETRQVVTGADTLSAPPSSRSVTVTTGGYGYSVGEKIDLRLETLDLADKGIATTVSVEVLRDETWDSERQNIKPVTKLETRTDATGKGTTSFKPTQSGYYRVNASVQDEQKRVSSSQTWVWVVGSESEVWSYRFDDLNITLDKTRYKPGDTVTALIQNPRPGTPILVSLEGGDLEGVKLLTGRAPVLRYSFRATQKQIPNVFISAVLMNGGRVFSNEKRVLIDDPKQQLEVTVSALKQRFGAGETTTLNIKTKDSSGVGVPAEVSVAVVDEGVYLIQPDTAPDITAFFHRPRGNAVGTEFSTNWYFEGVPRLTKPALAQAAPMAADATAKRAESKDKVSAAEPRVRQDFRDTALWSAQLVTDETGSAKLELKFPDNLTTWRVTTKGITRSGSAGESRRGLLVTQDVIARLGVPRTLVRGDSTQVSLVMNNNLSAAAKATLELRSTGLTASGDTTRQTTVNAGDRAALRVNVTANDVGTAKLQGRALTANASDALEIPVTVKARGFTERRAFSSDTNAGAQTINVASDAALETSRLTVLVTPSLTAAVAPALEYLVGYPYGCSEQTMSRFLPALLASRTLKQNDLSAATLKKLPEYVKSGIDRLEGFQHEDGGWGFWEYDESTLEMTAYVMGGLLRAKALDAKVSSATLERGLTFLKAAASQDRNSRNDRAAAYLTLSIAAQSPLEAMRRFASKDALEPSVLARMAIAFSRAGQKNDANDLLERLLSKRTETARGISWKNPDDARYNYWWSWDDNPVTTTALALEAVARVMPDSKFIPKIAAWLLTERQGARWVSTRDTAAVIEAALSLNEPQSETPTPVTVLLNGDPIKTLSVTRQASFELTGADGLLKRGKNTLELRGDKRILYSADTEYVREPATLENSNNGIGLTRTYEKLEAKFDTKSNTYSFTPKALLRGGVNEPVTVGEYLLVTLKVTAKDARYLVLSDAIPAGFKALETRTLPLADRGYSPYWEWRWDYWFSGLDIRDDRVDVYADRLNGANTIQYILRAETPGKYTALPAETFLMYEPSVNGRSSGATLTVRDRGQ